MKSGIHPEYKVARITCACGRVTETRATVEELHVEICSHCHPFFTGRQKLVDTAGRVERFRARYGRGDAGGGAAEHGEQEPASPEVSASAQIENGAAPAEEPAQDQEEEESEESATEPAIGQS